MHCLWPRQRNNISAKTSMALKPQIFSPVNLSPSVVCSGLRMASLFVDMISQLIMNYNTFYALIVSFLRAHIQFPVSKGEF